MWALRQGFVEKGFWCGYKRGVATSWDESSDYYGEYKIIKTNEEIEAAKRYSEEYDRREKHAYRCSICKKMVKGADHISEYADLKENPTYHPMGKHYKRCKTMDLKRVCTIE